MKKQLLNTKGFTLVELLVVIAIIAILATIGLTIYTGIQAGARDSKRIADINSIATAMETHYNSNQGQGCQLGAGNIGKAGYYCPLQAAWFANNVVPADPRSGAATCRDGAGGATGPCVYCNKALVSGEVAAPAACAGTDPVVAASIPAEDVHFQVCTNMEKAAAAPGGKDFYCKQGAQ
jgi:prepilin-type N-terminal cleavage/methylation domain-containing protein